MAAAAAVKWHPRTPYCLLCVATCFAGSYQQPFRHRLCVSERDEWGDGLALLCLWCFVHPQKQQQQILLSPPACASCSAPISAPPVPLVFMLMEEITLLCEELTRTDQKGGDLELTVSLVF